AYYLRLVLVALRPQRPDRPVDHACRQDGPFGRPPFTLEEAAGNLSGRVHPLFDVDGEREEVCALARLHPSLRRREHHRVAGANDDGAVRLLRQLSGLERHFAPADSHADLGSAFGGNCHQLSSTLLCREWGFESTPSAKSLRSSLKSPLSFFVPVPEFSLAWANILGLPAQP